MVKSPGFSVARMRAPEAFSEKVLQALSPSLRAGPVLVDPAALTVPSPPFGNRHVTWLEQGSEGAVEQELGPFARSLGAVPNKLMFVREGWLKMAPGGKS